MPTVITQGAASAKGYGFGASATAANYIEDVFSTWLYTGAGTGITIQNGIDLSTKGGLVWTKRRSSVQSHYLSDTDRGTGKTLSTDATTQQLSIASLSVSAFNTDGFSYINGDLTTNGQTYASWTFRKQAKFFDVVTYTGNGTNRTIAHSLGSVPGCIIIKQTTGSASDWIVYHRSLGNTKYIRFNLTDGEITNSSYWNNTSPTETTFALGTNSNVNGSSQTYVAYLFAHDAGGFGLTGTDNVISCGSWTDSGSGTQTITLGYEPQFLIYKRTDASSNWVMLDTMRGWPVVNAAGSTANLYPNLSNAESGGNYAGNGPTATGFTMPTLGGGTYIYIAIRRGPMKTPTTGTSVFKVPYVRTGGGATQDITGSGYPLNDLVITKSSSNTETWAWTDRLRGATKELTSAATTVETTYANDLTSFAFMNGFQVGSGAGGQMNTSGYTYIDYTFKRAPGFFDVVCYTGTGANRTVSHNLGVAPELMIMKPRSGAGGWQVYSSTTGNGAVLLLNGTAGAASDSTVWNNTTPTASVFSLGTSALVNSSGTTYVAYLFASVAGVSKVGSYTGTGTTNQINCGFTGGARFVLIKRNGTGDWYVWDTARGIVAGNDPYLLLNSTAAEVTTTDYVDTYSAGFEISSTAPAAINANGGTFIFLAIA